MKKDKPKPFSSESYDLTYEELTEEIEMKKDKEKHPRCKTCQWWKKEQSELEYNGHEGICVCPRWEFDSAKNGDIKILDRENRSAKFMGVHRFESINAVIPIGKVHDSRYALVTEEEFGCIYHEDKKSHE